MTVDVTDAASFAAATNAGPPAIADLERYRSYLAEWNEKMNLVGPATLDVFWSRHAWDSAQILPLAPDAAAQPQGRALGACGAARSP